MCHQYLISHINVFLRCGQIMLIRTKHEAAACRVQSELSQCARFVSYTSGSHILDFYVSKKNATMGRRFRLKNVQNPKMGTNTNSNRFGCHKPVIPVKMFYHTILAKKAKFLITFLLSTTQQQSHCKGSHQPIFFFKFLNSLRHNMVAFF